MKLNKAVNSRNSLLAKPKKKRLSAVDWLQGSLDLLAREGHSVLTIDKLCENLQVTKGSFYAHFKSRSDFERRLIEYWEDQFTASVERAMRGLKALSPEDRMFELLSLTTKERSAVYDVAVRAWAATHPELKDVIKETDDIRMGTIRGMMRKMGFRGRDLEMRTHVFVTYASFRWVVQSQKFDPTKSESLRSICELLTAK